MADVIYDTTGALPAGDANYAHLLTQAGSSLFVTNVLSHDRKALRAELTQQIHLAAGYTIRGAGIAVELMGAGSAFFNEGSVTSFNGTALAFEGGGTSTVTNTGTISGAKAITIKASTSASDKLHLVNTGGIHTTGVAVTGGHGDDRIYNTGIMSTSGPVLMDLGNGNDLYDGSQGTAIGTINLGAGNDTAYGGAASETFIGGDGDDFIDGGGGVDTVDYSGSANNLSINLQTTARQFTNQGWDTLLNIENVTGGAGHDGITGSNGDNVLIGGAGNDTLEGGLGSDVLEGGEGTDTARYNGTAGAFVNLAIAGPQNTGGYGFDTLTGIENLEGGSGSDSLTGNDLANRLTGNNGNDTLTGGKGNDTLEGGAGNDTLEGGEGNDSLEGGTGNDMAVFAGLRTEYEFPLQVTDDNLVFEVKDNVANRDGIDKLKSVRFLKFLGGTPHNTDDDVIVALSNAAPTSISLSRTTVTENAAVDTQVGTLSGADPDGDTLTYTLVNNAGGRFKLNSAGTGILVAGPIDYEAATQYTIQVKAQDGYGGERLQNLTITVQNVTETTPVVRHGTSASQQVVGELGHDRLYGLAGNDQLFGQAGNDTLYGGAGNDTLVGSTGYDVFVLDTAPNVRSNLDWIYDFNPKQDTIHLLRSVFTKIARGTLSSEAFVVGTYYKEKDDRILYHKTGGGLFYDADGSGTAYKPIQIATIGKNLAIAASDFKII